MLILEMPAMVSSERKFSCYCWFSIRAAAAQGSLDLGETARSFNFCHPSIWYIILGVA